MNLQKVQHENTGTSLPTSGSEAATLEFRPRMSDNINGFIGSLGAQLSFDEDVEQSDEESP